MRRGVLNIGCRCAFTCNSPAPRCPCTCVACGHQGLQQHGQTPPTSPIPLPTVLTAWCTGTAQRAGRGGQATARPPLAAPKRWASRRGGPARRWRRCSKGRARQRAGSGADCRTLCRGPRACAAMCSAHMTDCGQGETGECSLVVLVQHLPRQGDGVVADVHGAGEAMIDEQGEELHVCAHTHGQMNTPPHRAHRTIHIAHLVRR